MPTPFSYYKVISTIINHFPFNFQSYEPSVWSLDAISIQNDIIILEDYAILRLEEADRCRKGA
jgi:hypothetical protein